MKMRQRDRIRWDVVVIVSASAAFWAVVAAVVVCS